MRSSWRAPASASGPVRRRACSETIPAPGSGTIYVFSGIWQNVGWGSIIYLAALPAVDPGLHESAIVDGATKLRRIWHIDLPLLLPTVIILLILRCGHLLSVGMERCI